MSSGFHYLNGEFLPKDKCFFHISDLSIQRSYAVFDYFLFIEETPLYLEDYLTRFRNSVGMMGLVLPHGDEELRNIVVELIRINGTFEGGIKFIYTGGYAENGYDGEHPNFLIMHMPIPIVDQKYYDQGIKLILQEYVRDFPTAKTTDYFFSLSVKKQIKEANAFDLLYHKNGIISESSRSNFFIIDNENNVCTTEKDILFGVTRKNLIRAIEGKYNVINRPIRVDELPEVKEAFLTSSVKRVIPITQIDDLKIGSGKPGEVTLDLRSLLHEQDMKYIKYFNNI